MTIFRPVILAAALLLLLGGTGCKSGNEQASAPAPEQQPLTVESTPAQTQQEVQQAMEERVPVQGKVLETIDASSYTYVNVDTGEGTQWVAVPGADFTVGEEVSFAGGMEMKDLESKTLGRTFDSVVFSSGAISAGDSSAAAPAAPAAGDSFADALREESMGPKTPADMAASGGSMAAVVPSSDIQVEKAEGDNAYTVGELHAKKDELNNQVIVVRGKVMKVSPMIMGKNWIHIQDGTGDALNNTHDLVVTTMAEPEKDAVVVVEGTLHADRDFGAGYRYDVIIEDAEFK
ncbi:MAG TPA: DNA-binding protein [Desulfobacteraceae bacterium]|nr:DNA-binding protein [Desulfobacteraceae bacterium]